VVDDEVVDATVVMVTKEVDKISFIHILRIVFAWKFYYKNTYEALGIIK
jgi:hypothetical protein